MTTYKDIEKAANHINALIDNSRLYEACPLDIFELVDAINARLSSDYLSPDGSIMGAAFLEDSSYWVWPHKGNYKEMCPRKSHFYARTISLDTDLFEATTMQGIGQLNFTASHEAGHVLFHSDQSSGILACNNAAFNLNAVIDQREREANYFASCLLMPQTMIIQEIKKMYPDFDIENQRLPFNRCTYRDLVIPLAKKLKINPSPVKYRLSDLQLMDSEYIK